jgi:hypothetical protein
MSASRPCRFTAGERALGTHFDRRLFDTRAGLEAMEKRNSYPCREPNPDHLARSPSLYRFIYLGSYFAGWIVKLDDSVPEYSARMFGLPHFTLRKIIKFVVFWDVAL